MRRGKKPSLRWRIFETSALLAAVAGAVYLRASVLLPAIVPSPSMEPTLRVGDYLLINRLAYRGDLPVPGEIVAFHALDRQSVWVKRAVAGPGDWVEIRGGTLYRNNEPVEELYIQQELRPRFPRRQVPPDHVFVLGDNRDNSDDSRNWGPLRRDYLVGRVVFIYWPTKRLGRPL